MNNLTLLDILLYILLAFTAIIIFMSFILISLRLKGMLQKKRYNRFLKLHEEKLFEYLESNDTPEKYLSEMKKRKFPFLLEMIRDYALHLRGKDFERLAGIINSERVFNSLKEDILSGSKKRKLRAIYFWGLARNTTSKEYLKAALNSRNEGIVFSAAVSLARMKATENVGEIISSLLKIKSATNNIIISTLVEFDSEICPKLLDRIDIEDSDRVKGIIIDVLAKFTYIPAAKKVLYYLHYGSDPELLLSCLRYFMVIEYEPAEAALKFVMLKSSPIILSSAIKAAARIGTKDLEEIIYEKLFTGGWQIKLDSAEALYEISKTGREKLNSLAYNMDYPVEASVSRMILSEKEIAGK